MFYLHALKNTQLRQYVANKRMYRGKICFNIYYSLSTCTEIRWTWGGVVFKALRYSSDGPEIDSRWCHWIFQ
jgi:hypothetical protein